jgi:hypothetical protein
VAASSAASSPRGEVTVNVGGHLDRGDPKRPCTILSGSSRPPSTFRLIDHEAKK